MTDIEIANNAVLVNIREIADKYGINEEQLEQYGKYIAKIPYDLSKKIKNDKKHKLVLVTSMTPTKAGIGKTTVSVGLSMALNKIGEKSVVALREPSLGPCFGMKGGACGGGYSQVLPMSKINLHFTGDFHAITSAHNMIAAMLENHLYRTDKKYKKILWKRVLDVNDRSLRHIVTGLDSGNGVIHESGFDITPASEIMAIFCLSKDLDDLRRRLGNIVLAIGYDNEKLTVNDLGITGSIIALLNDAFNPNLVQTTEQTAAIIHGGPFANIAHGANSIVATKTAIALSDIAVTEAGFGSDLGAEKFMDIVTRIGDFYPNVIVVVGTIKGIRQFNENDLTYGCDNLMQHVNNMERYDVPVVIALNRHIDDSSDDIDFVTDYFNKWNKTLIQCDPYNHGGDGCVELAKAVEQRVNKYSDDFYYPYRLNDMFDVKLDSIIYNIYGASEYVLSSKAQKVIEENKDVIHRFPICVAKTQYSFSDNPKALVPEKYFSMTVRDIVINYGAEMIVVICGEIIRMPGLPKEPAAMKIDVENGKIIGLN